MRILAGVIAAAACSAALAAPAMAETYGVHTDRNVAVTLKDGTVLRADVFSPADPKTGEPAKGRFPVILTQTPYTKTAMEAVGSSTNGEMNDTNYFASRGYISIISDVRGTGGSTGGFKLVGPPEGDDGAQMVRWAAQLPNSSGKVGLLGPSYMGINQLFTAASVGKRSPLKAIFPIVAANDPYRDLAFHGGVANAESDIALIALTGALNTGGPLTENREDLAAAIQSSLAHLPATLDTNGATILQGLTGGERAFDGAYWRDRAPARVLKRIVRNKIPAYLVGGWLDVFQRGEPLNYAGLQNAWAGRTTYRPMGRKQKLTGRYQLLMGPWHHLNVGNGHDLRPIQLQWFDRWLKGKHNGIDRARTPLHLHDLGTGAYRDAKRYPLEGATPRTYYLGDSTLSRTKPAAATGADSLAFSPASSPCSRQTTQWSLGVLANAPCEADDRSFQQGGLTYTTAPFAKPALLAGPIGATLFASSTTKDAHLVVTIEDVAADGVSKGLTSGSLLASMRATDARRTWLTKDGRALLPYHSFTDVAKRPLTPGQVERLDVEVFPTYSTIKAGHRLRVTITTADTPHLLPSTAQLPDLLGGTTSLQRNAVHASSVQLPLSF